MSKKPKSLGESALDKFNAKKQAPTAPAAAEKAIREARKNGKKKAAAAEREARPKLFQVTPEAGRRFDMLRAKLGGGREIGPRLIAEALDLLFEKYGERPPKG